MINNSKNTRRLSGVESTSFVGSDQIAVTGEGIDSGIWCSINRIINGCRGSSCARCSLTDHIDVTLFSDVEQFNLLARSDKDVNSLDRSDSNLHKCEDGYSHGKASSKARHSKHKSKKHHGHDKMPPKKTTTPMTDASIKQLIAQGVVMRWLSMRATKAVEMAMIAMIREVEEGQSALLVKGTDVVSYTQCFKDLALMCGRMFPEESNEVEKYVGGLPDMIQGSIRTFAERQAENKRRYDNNLSDNNAQQLPFKRQNVARAYSAGPREKKEYAGTLPLCNKSPIATANNQRTLTCYECRKQGHYRSDCPELKNQNHRNQAGGTETRGMVYALGGEETDQDPNNMEDNTDA
ncbi:reverse transcriptase domain-containing protein [Tanacetum coccineum]